MMRRRAFLGTIALGALALARRAAADAPTIDARLAAIAQARAGLTTLQGPFTQTKTIGLMATQLKSSGTMWLERPSKLRWELAAPDSVVYWMLPAGLAYKGRNGQGSLPVTDRMAPQLADMKAFLGGDLASLKARYDLRELPADGGMVTIDGQTWDTSIWRDSKTDRSLVAVPKARRGTKGHDDAVVVSFTFVDGD